MKSTTIAYLLWLIGGFGMLGLHHLYLGRAVRWMTYMLTGGILGIGALYDLFTLPIQVKHVNESMRDLIAEKYPVKK